MPRKRQKHQARSFKPAPVTFSARESISSSSLSSSDKPTASVNQLLANLRRASAAPSAPLVAPAPAPSLPPSIREVLQLAESPAPLPRQRVRFDERGRQLPAGPAPPRSWILQGHDVHTAQAHSAAYLRSRSPSLAGNPLSHTYEPAPGSLIDLILRRMASSWKFHRDYDQYYLHSISNHLKPVLIRYIGLFSDQGVTVADLKIILLPPVGFDDEDDAEAGRGISVNSHISCLDLSGSIGKSLTMKELARLLFPSGKTVAPKDVQESWDAVDAVPSPPRTLLPNLTHMSVALDRGAMRDASWRQLLELSSKLSTVTHLSLAFWPQPRLSSPTTQSSLQASSGIHASSLAPDDNWGEALLVLRLLSRNLYRLEYLDLSGCASWFQALTLQSGHDFVDWVWTWGKISCLRLYAGWTPSEGAPPSERLAYRDAAETARSIERHIIAKRAGKAMFITVERDSIDT